MENEKNSPNGWNEWAKYVLKELERLNEGQKETNDQMQLLRTDVAMLKVKAGIWGAVAGSIPAIGTLIIALLLKFIP